MILLFLIPARKGSKRLPGKNFMDFCGKPLWLHSVHVAMEASLELSLFKKTGFNYQVVLSTDHEIKDLGAGIPAGVDYSKRPDSLCLDSTTTQEVVEYEVRRVQEAWSDSVDTVVLLQPTSPLRSVRNVVQVVENHLENPVGRLNGCTFSTIPPRVNIPDGRVYVIGSREALSRDWPGESAAKIVTDDPWRAVDIDTLEDFKEAARRYRTRGYMTADPTPDKPDDSAPLPRAEFDSVERILRDAEGRLKEIGCTGYGLFAPDPDAEQGTWRFTGPSEIILQSIMMDELCEIIFSRALTAMVDRGIIPGNIEDDDGDDWKRPKGN